jgi:nucleoside-diphosphate-sugar epimerase
MRVFVTGATGVLGRRVVPMLVGGGHEVTAVGRTADKRAALRHQGARPIELDLFNLDAVGRALGEAEIEAVINLATAVPPGFRGALRWSWRRNDLIRTRVSANLIAAALSGSAVRRVIQDSFAPIYRDRGDQWVDESAPVQPAAYNRTVLDAEVQAAALSRAGRIGVVLRFGFLYGPHDAATGLLLTAVRRGWFPLIGDPEGFASWVAHGDAAAAVVAALAVPAGIYNVVDDRPLRRREMAAGIAQLEGVAGPRLLPGWAWPLAGATGRLLARSLRISNRKLRAASAWAPQFPSILEGLAAITRTGRERTRVHATMA